MTLVSSHVAVFRSSAGNVIRFVDSPPGVVGRPYPLRAYAYDEGFTPDGLVAYQLNCGPVGTVQPGASVTFAMRFTVPSKTPVGPEKFGWALRGADALASAGSLVTVTAH